VLADALNDKGALPQDSALGGGDWLDPLPITVEAHGVCHTGVSISACLQFSITKYESMHKYQMW
jgi:hypothetical protein